VTSPEEPQVAWRFTFYDLLTRRPLARLPLVDADLSEVIGGPADGSGTVPVINEQVRARDPWTATTPRRSLMLAQRVVSAPSGRIVASPALWAGIIWKRVRSGRALKLSLSTPESYWRMRLVAADRTFSQADDAVILRTVIGDAEAVPYGSLGVDLGADLIGARSDRTVIASEQKTVLETAQSIATGGNGFDWRLAPGVDAAGAPALSLRAAPALGSTVPGGRVWVSAPDGRPGNELVGYELTEDGAGVPNRMVGLGGGDGPDRLTSVQTVTDELTAGYPLLEAAEGSSTQDLITQEYVDKHTIADLREKRLAEVQVTSMTVRGDRGPTVDTYGLGDTVELRLRDPLHPAPLILRARIVGRRIQPPQPGRNETVALTLRPVSP
jgi:hypothetical protein